jgi:hypothetical protein
MAAVPEILESAIERLTFDSIFSMSYGSRGVGTQIAFFSVRWATDQADPMMEAQAPWPGGR